MPKQTPAANSTNTTNESLVAFLAPDGFLPQLLGDLVGVADVIAVHERLVVARPNGAAVPSSPWAQNTWLAPKKIKFTSIKDAARQLAAIQRNWWPYAATLHRRTEHIQKELPHVAGKPLIFPAPAPTAPLGSFTLLDETTMLASPQCSSPFPNGEATFQEFGPGQGPPSRAYLKLFEALTLAGTVPRAGEHCLELGASPGGWTWVVARLGAEVIGYDRAPLAPEVLAMPGVTGVVGDAFQARPDKIEGTNFDWLFSDIICYPEKLFEFVSLWLDSGRCRNFVCTLKFQGDSHYGVVKKFLTIVGSRVVHLSHNKHELTWILLR